MISKEETELSDLKEKIKDKGGFLSYLKSFPDQKESLIEKLLSNLSLFKEIISDAQNFYDFVYSCHLFDDEEKENSLEEKSNKIFKRLVSDTEFFNYALSISSPDIHLATSLMKNYASYEEDKIRSEIDKAEDFLSYANLLSPDEKNKFFKRLLLDFSLFEDVILKKPNQKSLQEILRNEVLNNSELLVFIFDMELNAYKLTGNVNTEGSVFQFLFSPENSPQHTPEKLSFLYMLYKNNIEKVLEKMQEALNGNDAQYFDMVSEFLQSKNLLAPKYKEIAQALKKYLHNALEAIPQDNIDLQLSVKNTLEAISNLLASPPSLKNLCIKYFADTKKDTSKLPVHLQEIISQMQTGRLEIL